MSASHFSIKTYKSPKKKALHSHTHIHTSGLPQYKRVK